MKILFVHKFFPTQFRHLANALAEDSGNEVVALTGPDTGDPAHTRPIQSSAIRVVRFSHSEPDKDPGPARFAEPVAKDMALGWAVFKAAEKLRDADGFVPDIVCANTLWGECTFVKEVYPSAKLLAYFDIYYRLRGTDTDFGPGAPPPADSRLSLMTKNATLALAAARMDWGVVPSNWQQGLLPASIRDRVSVAHEGIDTRLARPGERAVQVAGKGIRLTKADEVVTFAARFLESVRGFETFMRAVPTILSQRPNAHIVIIGAELPPPNTPNVDRVSQLPALRRELGDRLDERRVHFPGRLAYADYLAVMQISTVHVYLTVPFILSWSMLEAMSCGAVLVGADNSPVTEVIQHERNGLLVDFFDPDAVADAAVRVLRHENRMSDLAAAGQKTIREKYDFRTVCFPRHLGIIKKLIAGQPTTD